MQFSASYSHTIWQLLHNFLDFVLAAIFCHSSYNPTNDGYVHSVVFNIVAVFRSQLAVNTLMNTSAHLRFLRMLFELTTKQQIPRGALAIRLYAR